jgi:hypothetical protein
MDNLSVTRVAIREHVCAACFRCPPHRDDRPLSRPRDCEPSCEVFLHLPRLIKLVQRFGGEQPCGYETALRNLPCGTCRSSVRCTDTCQTQRPLERYADEIMAVLEFAQSRSRQS